MRAAIQVANSLSTNDTIGFSIPTSDPGYNAATGTYTITIGSSLPDLSGNLAIEGPGADKLIIKPLPSTTYRIFRVTATGTVSFSGITITGGVSASGLIGAGGGIENMNSAHLIINNCTLSNNAGGGGGGIHSPTGPVDITGSKFISNFALFGGGGLSIGSGTSTVTGCTFSQNMCAAGDGGGISASGTVTITNSTFDNNSARTGAALGNSGGTLTVKNSTFSANTPAGPSGGTINNSTGSMTLVNCTVGGNNLVNSSNAGAGGVYVTGGTVHVQNTMVALNTATGFNVTPDVGGTFISDGNNLVGKKDGSTGFTAATDHTGTIAAPLDPNLDPTGLQNNGGATRTVRLLSPSAAINNGNDAAAPARDQRGYVRSGTSDIGAFEFAGTLPVTLGNISTRAFVQTGDNVLIGGFIIGGTGAKQVLLRALGPTLGKPPFNLPNVLANPQLSLFDANSNLVLANDNWGSAANAAAINATGKAPPDSSEAAILISLNPGRYTAIVSGVNNATGVALFDAYDQDLTTTSYFSNISTRSFVQTGANVMIAGVIVQGPDSENVIIRGLGPTLGQPPFNVPNALQDPFLDLRDANGTRITANDNWKDTQQGQITATPYAPPNDAESAIVITLAPGNYTAILSGVNNSTGNALVEVYSLNSN